MNIHSGAARSEARGGIPRGLASDGPAILSYGFRPFFLAAGLWGLIAMLTWLFALGTGFELGGSYGALAWHGHEMLFGYSSAALAGFLLTAVPNWTGRLPVAGRPLLALVLLWTAGRVAMAWPDVAGAPLSAAIDAAFLVTLGVIVAREVVAGRNWKNLKVLGGVGLLASLNVWGHVAVIGGDDAQLPFRLAVGVYVVLVAIVGGRIIPSFTRNWLARSGSSVLPVPFGRFDIAAIITLALALGAWAVAPDWQPVAFIAAAAALLNAWRLWRWCGLRTLEEPLVFVLHAGYAFVPIGLAATGVAALGWISTASAMHVLTVGVIGMMTLAVMTRATRGHTGRPLSASLPTSLSYLLMLVAAVVRPFAELVPAHYHLILMVGGGAWIGAFVLFVAEHWAMLTGPTARRG